jgi:hypothetical protein
MPDVTPLREVCPIDVLRTETAPGVFIYDTGKCYICGESNYAPSHMDSSNLFSKACPTGITRAEADFIRRERGEHVR